MLAVLLQRRLIIIIVIVLIIVSAGVYLYMSSNDKSKEKVTLTYWGLWESKEMMKPYIDKFQSENPNVTINYEQKSLTGYRRSLEARIKAGTGPDIFLIHNTWLPALPNVSNLNQNLFVAPVSNAIYSAQQIEKDFYPTVTESLSLPTYDTEGKVNGKQYYAIPLQFDSLALVYNQDLVTKKQTELAGADVSWPPKTWNEFQRAALVLTEKDQADAISVSGAALGTATNVDNFSDIVGLLLLQNQVKFIENKVVKFHTNVDIRGNNLAADVLSFYTGFGGGKNKTWDDNLPNSTKAFADGKVAMILVPSWRLHDIADYQKASGIKFTYKTAMVPQVAQAPTVTWATYWAQAVSVKAKSREASWKFVKYLSQNEVMRNMYADQSKLRGHGQLYSRQDLAESLKNDPMLYPFIQSGPKARSWYLASGTRDESLEDKNIEQLTTAINYIRKQNGDSSSALRTFAFGVSQNLNTVGLASPLQN